jgi:hypothetical protein
VRRQLCEQLSAHFRLYLTCHRLPTGYYCRLYLLQFAGGELSYPPILAGFVYLEFSQAPAPPLFSSVESYQPATVGLVCLEIVWGTALLPLSGEACCMSATVASLAHLKLTVGSHQFHLLWQACLFKVRMGACPFPFVRSSRHPALFATCPFQFFVFYSVFFPQGRSRTVQGAMLVYPRGGCGDTTCHLFAHLLVCVSQAG